MAIKDLLLKIKADGKQASAEMKRVSRDANKMVDNVQRAGYRGRRGMTQMEKSALASRLAIRQLTNSVKALAGAAALGALVHSIYRSASAYEKLQVQLKVATGSAQQATDVFSALKALSTGLPVSVSEITTAFIRMRNLGLQPTQEALISFTNTSAAMGKTLMDFIEAVADAATGEFERLKEFGIKASKQGDQVAFTFKGVTTVVQNNADAITAYLQQLGENDFAGAATEQMQTLSGAVSNLGVSWDNLMDSIGRAGANGAMGRTLLTFTTLFEDLAYAIGDSNQKGREMPGAFEWMLTAAKYVAGNVHDMALAFEALGEKIGMVMAIMNVKVGAGMFDQIGAILDMYQERMSDLNRQSQEFWDRLNNGTAPVSADQMREVINRAARAPDRPSGSAQRIQATTTAVKQQQKEINKLANEYRRLMARLDPAQAKMNDYAHSLSVIKGMYDAGKISSDDYLAALEKLELKFNDTGRQVEKLKDKTETTFDKIKNVTTDAFRKMEDALVEFTMTGKFSFRDFASSVINDIMRIAIQQSITQPLASSFGSFFGDIAKSIGGSLFGGGVGTVKANALGGVYGGKGISAYSNQIVDKPTVFPFARGVGLMGEAGPEAIMPLVRTPSGHLGVRAEGGGGVVVNIVEAPGRGGEVNQRQEGGRNVIEVFVEQVKSAIAGDIATGRGQVPQALQRTYGLNRVAGAY